MNKILIGLMATVVMVSGLPTARAQFAVIDPANLVQNILTAARSLIQIDNQVKQLENEARNLQSLNFSSLGQFQTSLARISNLMRQAQGLSFQLNQATQQFSRLYPNGYAGASRARMAADGQARWVNSHEAVRMSIELQAQVNANLSQDESVLADLVNQSQGATGALQAAQATNQLLALNAKHLMQVQQMALAQDRSVAAEHARGLEAEARTQELRQRFMTPATVYVPQDVAGIN